MSRFEDIDLARLGGVPDLVAVDFETEYQALREGFLTRWNALRVRNPELPALDAIEADLETDPVVVLMQEFAYRLTTVRAAYNDGVRAVMLASTWGEFLEHRAAEFGLTRAILERDPQTGEPTLYESDDELRRRRQMAIEAISNAGPYGAYVWFALGAHPQVKGVAVYGPESELVDPGEVLIVVLDRRGDGSAGSQVLRAITARLVPDEVRPLTEKKVQVQSAAIVPYDVDIVIRVLPGPGIEEIEEAARKRVQNYVLDRHKIGAKVTRAGLEAAATVVDSEGRSLVEEVQVIAPLADVTTALLEAPFARSLALVAKVLGDD